MNEFLMGKSKDVPFYDGNVVLKRELGTDGEFTCMSSHMCGEDCKSKDDKKKGVT